MSEPFLGEIKVVSFNFAPTGWAFCDGQLLPINQNQALFAILGTTYGGDGRTNFALPNFQGATPVHFGNGFTLGQTGGERSHTLAINEIPAHHHLLASALQASSANPAGNVLASKARGGVSIYAAPGANVNIGTPAGASQPHNNLQPYLALNFIIALQGIFPSQN
jgi:microcystin-dependent protein